MNVFYSQNGTYSFSPDDQRRSYESWCNWLPPDCRVGSLGSVNSLNSMRSSNAVPHAGAHKMCVGDNSITAPKNGKLCDKKRSFEDFLYCHENMEDILPRLL